MTNEIMEYIGSHPEKADIIFTFENKTHHCTEVYYKREQTSNTGNTTLIKQRSIVSPRTRLDMFNGVPVYTIWGEGEVVYVPVDAISLISVEHKESDTSQKQEVIIKYSYENANHTLEISFNEEYA